jgi:hypothetical protein
VPLSFWCRQRVILAKLKLRQKTVEVGGVELKWLVRLAVFFGILWTPLAQLVFAGDSCPAPKYRHLSKPLSFILSGDSKPIFKAAAKFEEHFDGLGVDFLEVIGDSSGIYIQNKSGEVGLPLHILRVVVDLFDGDSSGPCRLTTLFPGQRLHWKKWPSFIELHLNDLDLANRDPIKGTLQVEIYR